MSTRVRTEGRAWAPAGGLAVVVALAGLAGAAQGQSAEPRGTVIVQPSAPAQSGSSLTSVYEMSAPGKQVRVEIVDGKVKATVNGKAIDAKRVERDGGQVRVLDVDGSVIASFGDAGRRNVRAIVTRPGQAVAPGAAGPMELRAQRQLQAEELARLQVLSGVAQAMADEDPPPVMLGITMSEVSDEVLDSLGLDGGVMLERVIEGLPASEAGLRERDLIFKADGKSVIDQESLRSQLRKKQPGDVFKLGVVRRGERLSVEVKLRAYDAEKLGNVTAAFSPAGPSGLSVPGVPVAPVPPAAGWASAGTQPTADAVEHFVARSFGNSAEAIDRLKSAMAAIERAQGSAKLSSEASEALNQAMEVLAELRDDLAQGGFSGAFGLTFEPGDLRFFGSGGGGDMFAIPQASGLDPKILHEQFQKQFHEAFSREFGEKWRGQADEFRAQAQRELDEARERMAAERSKLGDAREQVERQVRELRQQMEQTRKERVDVERELNEIKAMLRELTKERGGR